MSWFTKAIKSCGKTIGSGVSVAVSPIGAVGKEIKKIPVVGKPFGAVYGLATAPYDLTARIASGARLDHAVVGHFKGQLADAKTIAPYAQTVVSFVPGIGQGVSAAIGTSLALADGRPINDALIEAVKGALPGGPAVQAAFNIAAAAAQGKPIDEIAIAALPLPDAQKKAIKTAAHIAKDLAAGKKVSDVVIKNVQDYLPKEVNMAINTGVAIGHGKKLQDAVIQNVGPELLSKVAGDGARIIAANPVMKAGADMLKDPKLTAGFKVGAAFASNKVRPIDLVAVRKKLDGQQKQGFDMALAAHIGQVIRPPSKSGKHSPKSQFGYYLTHGMREAEPKHKVAMMKVVAADSAARIGATTAIKEVQWTQAPWWKRLLAELGVKVG